MSHDNAVDLLQPGRLNGEMIGQTTAILGNSFRAVVDVIAEIEAVERRQTDAARSGGHTGFDPGRRGPVRNQPVTHPMNASRSCLSRVSNQTKSSGNGDSQLMR
ncbi:hypothetical protein D9M72_566620 [compost metagenome]